MSGHDAAKMMVEDWEDVVTLFDLSGARDRASPFEVVAAPDPHVAVWVRFWSFLFWWEYETG